MWEENRGVKDNGKSTASSWHTLGTWADEKPLPLPQWST